MLTIRQTKTRKWIACGLYVIQQTDGPIHYIPDRRHHHCLLFKLFTLLISVFHQNNAK